MEMQNWSERMLLVLIIVLLSFINIKESLGKSLLANNFNMKNNKHNYLFR